MWFKQVYLWVWELPKEEDEEPRGQGVELPALVGLPVSKLAAEGALEERLWWSPHLPRKCSCLATLKTVSCPRFRRRIWTRGGATCRGGATGRQAGRGGCCLGAKAVLLVVGHLTCHASAAARPQHRQLHRHHCQLSSCPILSFLHNELETKGKAN